MDNFRLLLWLRQWLSVNEARRLVASLSWDRRSRLIASHHTAIEQAGAWSTGGLA